MSPIGSAEPKKLIVITGAAGSGIGTAVRSLKDFGFNGIDNLPFELFAPTVGLLETKQHFGDIGLAIGVHLCNYNQILEFKRQISEQRKRFDVALLCLFASKDVLMQRFNTTRRRHPLARLRPLSMKVLDEEEFLLGELVSVSDHNIDTTYLSPGELACKLETLVLGSSPRGALMVSITSFGFKYGLCTPLESLYDVRFLKNPFFAMGLREKSGLDSEVEDFIASDKNSVELLDRICDLNSWLLPKYHSEGKSYFRIGVGCTGGRHRSVYIAKSIKDRLVKELTSNISIEVYHRDIRN